MEGGGFCGARTLAAELDLGAFDGICLRVRSDGGQTFKLNIKTVGGCGVTVAVMVMGVYGGEVMVVWCGR